MSQTMYVQVLPPGDREQLVCDDCACAEFHLFSESRDGKIEFFHTVCTACGKRGSLSSKVEFTQTNEFMQFADPPPGFTEGQLTTTTTTAGGPDENPSE